MCDNNDFDDNQTHPNSSNMGWSDAINKILNSKSNSNKFILSKAKKDKHIRLESENTAQNIDIVDHNGDVKPIDDQNRKTKRVIKRKRTDWEKMNKLKPDLNDKPKELMLASIATKGVVQLFNAVRQQQITYQSKLNDHQLTDTKKDKELAKFTKLDLSDKNKRINVSKKKEKPIDTSKPQLWDILSDNFMVGAKMKDWDKDSDSDNYDQ